jgi:hypothetical protein
MSRSLAATLLAAGVLLAAGCGEKDEPGTTTASTPASTTTTTTREGDTATETEPANSPKPQGPTPAELAAKRRREAESVVDDYIKALDRRDGAAVCALLAPGALDQVKLPHERGSCAASLEASIGYKDPRGLPQFAGVAVAQHGSTQVGPNEARVTVTIVTRFADRTEPSIEDDLVYLTRVGGRLKVAQASTALYRAVGIADIPPSVISPPEG